MSTTSTEGKTMQVRVYPDVYAQLFDLKVELEKTRKKSASFNDVLEFLLDRAERAKA